MKILALEEDLTGTVEADSAALLLAEARAVWDLVQAGTIRGIYFREGRTQAVIMLEAESTRQAQEILAGMPLVKAGRTRFEVIGLQPYPGFARLFAV
jgi:muconolactone delta-isomerase